MPQISIAWFCQLHSHQLTASGPTGKQVKRDFKQTPLALHSFKEDQMSTHLWLPKDSVDSQNMIKDFIEQHQWNIKFLFIKHLIKAERMRLDTYQMQCGRVVSATDLQSEGCGSKPPR